MVVILSVSDLATGVFHAFEQYICYNRVSLKTMSIATVSGILARLTESAVREKWPEKMAQSEMTENQRNEVVNFILSAISTKLLVPKANPIISAYRTVSADLTGLYATELMLGSDKVLFETSDSRQAPYAAKM